MASNARVEAAKTEPSIFKEPMHFRDVNEKKAYEPEIKAPYHMNQKAYEPEIMAIGPYHRGKENLQMMEEHKVRYLDSLLQRRNQNVEIYNSAVRELEQQARNCYTEPISLNSAEFVQMLVLDGCFIIELILRYADAPSNTSAFKDDPIFQTTFVMNRLQRDLILLDNQIPFSILSKLFDLISHGNLIEHILTFFRDLYPRAGYKDKTNEISKEQVKHLLDLIHKMWIPSSDYNVDTRESNQTEKGFESNRTEMGFEFNQAEEGFESIRPATELYKANVRFHRKECDNLFEIEFRDGIMLLPHLTISARTECFFRNLIAYEQYIPIYQRTRVTDYVWLMHCLINSGRDVEILHEYGIIENFLGSYQVVADMFNQLTDSVTDPTDNFVYAETFRLISTHYREHRARAVLKRDYFYRLWSYILDTIRRATAVFKRDYFYRLWAYIPDTIHRARAVFNASTPHHSILGQIASRSRILEVIGDKFISTPPMYVLQCMVAVVLAFVTLVRVATPFQDILIHVGCSIAVTCVFCTIVELKKQMTDLWLEFASRIALASVVLSAISLVSMCLPHSDSLVPVMIWIRLPVLVWPILYLAYDLLKRIKCFINKRQ